MDSNDYWACRLTKLGKVQLIYSLHLTDTDMLIYRPQTILQYFCH